VEAVLLETIPFEVDLEALEKKTGAKKARRYADDIRQLAAEAQAVARPKALYKVTYIEDRGDDFVVVAGVTLTSRVLQVNLAAAHRAFPFVATCGVELESWAQSLNSDLRRYWADAIQRLALDAASAAFLRDLNERFQPGATSAMYPGSLADWPLEEQRPLFALLGDTRSTVGVQLKDSMLMAPIKTISGIRFPTEESFESCQLCPREECPGRKSPYDAGLYERKYRS